MQIILNTKPQSNKVTRIAKKRFDDDRDAIRLCAILYQACLAIEDLECLADMQKIRDWVKRSLIGNRHFNRTRLNHYLNRKKEVYSSVQ